MTDFQEHLIRVAHIPERSVSYYIRWVRQPYELAHRPPGEPLSRQGAASLDPQMFGQGWRFAPEFQKK